MITRLKEIYDKELSLKLMTKMNLKNKHDLPKITKIVLNMGLGEDANDNKKLKVCLEDLSLIAGQKAIATKFRKSIANFKTRKGTSAGVKVTLRSHKMYEFLDRLVNIALPRIKDFRGLSVNGLDKFGNYTVGLTEQLLFPEISYDSVDQTRGFNITFVTNAKTREAGAMLLREFGLPLREKI